MQRKIVVFASGNGSNFQNIVEKSKENNYEVTLLFCDRKKAKVIERSKSLSIPFKFTFSAFSLGTYTV